jgi:hypothetical protein
MNEYPRGLLAEHIEGHRPPPALLERFALGALRATVPPPAPAREDEANRP